LAWAKPGDTILAMDLSHGGHLTHGAPVTAAARIFNFVHYGMKNSELARLITIKLPPLAKKHHPKIIVAGFRPILVSLITPGLAKSPLRLALWPWPTSPTLLGLLPAEY
jgi:glycine/serine hydroxymethyltransferase